MRNSARPGRSAAAAPSCDRTCYDGLKVERSLEGGPWQPARDYASALEFIDGGLQAQRAYSYRIRYRNADGVETGPSPSVPVFTDPTVPPAPTGLFAVAASGQVTLTWNPVAGAANYKVRRRPADGPFDTEIPGLTAPAHADTTVANGQEYRYVVRAVNSAGESADSAEVSATPMAIPAPPAPTGLVVTAQTTSSISYQWNEVAGATGYRFFRGSVAVGTLPAAQTTFTLAGLPENESVSAVVRAFNNGGESPSSTSVAKATFITRPGPSSIRVEVLAANRAFVYVTTPPLPYWPTAAHLQRRLGEPPDPDRPWTDVATESITFFADVQGISGNQEFRIRYRNRSNDWTDFSDPLLVVMGKPPAPANLTGVADSTNSILWTWDAVSGAGGYEVDDALHAPRSFFDKLPRFQETGLAENTPYTRHIHASNLVDRSDPTPNVTRHTLVRSPVDFSLTVASTTSIVITVPLPPNAFSGLTGLSIRRRIGAGAFDTLSIPAGQYVYADNGLPPGTDITYVVAYVNGDGVITAYSPEKLEVTIPKPVITTGSKKVRSTTPRIAGTVPGDVLVRIYFTGVLRGEVTAGGGAWSFVAPATAEGSYTVTARSFVEGLESTDSNAITVTVDMTRPPPPANVRTTAYNQVIDIEWDPSPASDVVGYKLFRKVGPDGEWVSLNPTGLIQVSKYRDRGSDLPGGTLSNGTAYFYKVIAIDDAIPDP